MEVDQRFAAHLFCFRCSLSFHSFCNFAIQYFVSLPYEYISYGYHLAWKLVSVSRRIFLGFTIRFLFIAFAIQYFVFLPYEYASYGYHLAWKLISVSRRIFLGFDIRFLFIAFAISPFFLYSASVSFLSFFLSPSLERVF